MFQDTTPKDKHKEMKQNSKNLPKVCRGNFIFNGVHGCKGTERLSATEIWDQNSEDLKSECSGTFKWLQNTFSALGWVFSLLKSEPLILLVCNCWNSEFLHQGVGPTQHFSETKTHANAILKEIQNSSVKNKKKKEEKHTILTNCSQDCFVWNQLPFVAMLLTDTTKIHRGCV